MTKNKRFVKFNITANDDYTILNGVKDNVTGEWYHTIDNVNAKRLYGLLNELHEENQDLKEENEYLCEKIKENEWHWNTIDEDRDVWMHKCKRLEEDNKRLKFQLNDCLNKKLFSRRKLEEENEQLKQELKTKCIVNKQYEENQRLIKMLDNVANYMQKQNKYMPIDDFVEWWNGIATKGLDDGDVE